MYFSVFFLFLQVIPSVPILGSGGVANTTWSHARGAVVVLRRVVVSSLGYEGRSRRRSLCAAERKGRGHHQTRPDTITWRATPSRKTKSNRHLNDRPAPLPLVLLFPFFFLFRRQSLKVGTIFIYFFFSFLIFSCVSLGGVGLIFISMLFWVCVWWRLGFMIFLNFLGFFKPPRLSVKCFFPFFFPHCLSFTVYLYVSLSVCGCRTRRSFFSPTRRGCRVWRQQQKQHHNDHHLHQHQHHYHHHHHYYYYYYYRVSMASADGRLPPGVPAQSSDDYDNDDDVVVGVGVVAFVDNY